MSWPTSEFERRPRCDDAVRAILTYHSIDESGSPISIDPATFHRHVEWLASGRLRVVSLDALARDHGGDEDMVALTFDDGCRNLGTEAAPRLLDSGLPATVFVVSDQVGRTNSWGGRVASGIPELPLLTWTELRHLADSGITIGSHTRRHPRLTGLDPESLDDELRGSATRIEAELGIRPQWLAYPYGANDRTVVERSRECYRGAVTTEYRAIGVGEDPLRLPRLDAFYFRRRGTLERWGTPAFRRSLWLRRLMRETRAAVAGSRGNR